MARRHDQQPVGGAPTGEESPVDPQLELQYACHVLSEKNALVRDTLVALIEKGEVNYGTFMRNETDSTLAKRHHALADSVVEMVNIVFKGLQEA